jgi:putative transposase
MLADTFGRPLRFIITAGQASDIASAPDLLEGQRAKAVLADKAYDGNDLRDRIAGMNATAVIPSKRNRKVAIPHDAGIYKHRNQIERCFSQAFPSLRHPLRSTHHPLQRLRTPRRHHDMPTMNVDPT